LVDLGLEKCDQFGAVFDALDFHPRDNDESDWEMEKLVKLPKRSQARSSNAWLLAASVLGSSAVFKYSLRCPGGRCRPISSCSKIT
jgi:hypothetical protein